MIAVVFDRGRGGAVPCVVASMSRACSTGVRDGRARRRTAADTGPPTAACGGRAAERWWRSTSNRLSLSASPSRSPEGGPVSAHAEIEMPLAVAPMVDEVEDELDDVVMADELSELGLNSNR